MAMRGSVVSTSHANQQPYHHQAEGEHDHLVQIHFAVLNEKFEVVAVATATTSNFPFKTAKWI